MSMPRSAALPVSFGDDFALYHPSWGDTGYVICGTWGYSELCSRKFLRQLSEDLCEAGFPILRIDYPGTTNMLDPDPTSGAEGWISTAVNAGDRLREISGCSRILYFGLGIGAAIAFLAAQRRSDVDGIVLAGPVTSGRRYLRELQLHAKVTNDELGLAMEGKTSDTGFSGFTMDEDLQAELKKISLTGTEILTKPHCLILARDGMDTDRALGTDLSDLGFAVQTLPFDGYAALMSTPATSIMPEEVIANVVAWSTSEFKLGKGPAIPGVWVDSGPVIVHGDGFTEEPVTFGPDNRYFGILCRPEEENPSRPVAVFLNSSYCHHVGWGRIWVRAARNLARKGIPSFRFDMANVGESLATEGEPDQVLYTDGQFDDVTVVIDYLTKVQPGPIVLIGRCSGAYVAFNVAPKDDRVSGLLLINQLKLVWNPGDSIEDELHSGARPFDEYRRRAMSLKTVKRILSGKVNLTKAGQNIFKHLRDRVIQKLAPYLGPLTQLGRFRKICFDKFEAMRLRNIPIHIVTCENDGSLDEFARYFGSDCGGLTAYPNVHQHVICDADHNLTPEHSKARLLELLEEILVLNEPRATKPPTQEDE